MFLKANIENNGISLVAVSNDCDVVFPPRPIQRTREAETMGMSWNPFAVIAD